VADLIEREAALRCVRDWGNLPVGTQLRNGWNNAAAEARSQIRSLPAATDDRAGHCVDCCCARSWKALGVSEYDGMSIPEHIERLRAERSGWVYPTPHPVPRKKATASRLARIAMED